MEQMTGSRWGKAWYALPVIGAAIPAIMALKHRSVCREEEVEEERGSKDRMLVKQSNINLVQALNTALKYVPGTPVEVELEENCGMPVWEVEIVPKKGGPTRDVRIDARTGDLLELRSEFSEAK